MSNGNRRTRQCRRETNSDGDELKNTLGAILDRLNALENREDRVNTPSTPNNPPAEAPRAVAVPLSLSSLRSSVINTETVGTSTCDTATDRIVGALNALTKVRSTHYFISNFDPSINDFDSWCNEVDRGLDINRWDDSECLSRIANCLKGEARSWLNQWVTNDRSWSNFKREFKSLCPRRVDIANLLFEVMNTNSDNYDSYAEYARRSILKLKVVNGLSDELTVAIIIRGINDPQIRASATNAKLLSRDLVEFLSIYTKPKRITDSGASTSRGPVRLNRNRVVENNSRKRSYPQSDYNCYSCGVTGHVQKFCTKRTNTDMNTDINTNKANDLPTCSYCKKVGHSVDTCFAKERSKYKYNKKDVNLCREYSNNSNDVTSVVIQGVPIDALIDSGSCVSLISESVLKHFNCNQVPLYQVLKGIGSQNIESICYVTLVVQFNEISLEVDLLVVSDNCISVPIIIGTDVLNRKGVTYVRTASGQRLMHNCESFTSNPSSGTVMYVQSNSQLEINSPLLGIDREKLLTIIQQFSSNFIVGTATSTVTTGTMSIRLNSDTPIYYRPYKLSYDEKLRVRRIIQELLDKEIIRESESSYASPIILVKKKDGSDRMCVDYRALNAITIKERFPLPLIEDHVDRLGKSNFFSCIDMATGFHQLKLDSDSIDKTAFITPEGHFEYLKMPYGLANAPAVYQKIITKTLRKHIENGTALVFIDDVLIVASTIDQALENLQNVLSTLIAAGFSINIKKSTFVATEIEYLGRIISRGQVRPSIKKIQALVDSPVPTNVKQIRQLLGLAGYFRRYIRDYATKTIPISMLTRNGIPFLWGEEQKKAHKYLIDCLTNEPVLAIFDPTLPTELHTDASSAGYGAVLLQEHESKRRRVIAYFSRTTKGAEPRYCSYELETLAVVKAFQNFRHYLLGIEFKLITDCNSLKLTIQKKDLLPRVARWWMYMQDYNFTIEYRKGTFMSHADFFSKNPVNVHNITRPKSWAKIAQSADEETRTLIDKLNNNELDSDRYIVRNDLLYYKYSPTGNDTRLLCYIPKGHRLSLLRIFHDQHQHIGVDKTLDLILRHFWFPAIRAFVKKYISHCITCLSSKRVPRAPLQPISSWVKPNTPFNTIHMDVLGPLPRSKDFKYVLILIDSYTKYCLLYSMCKLNSHELMVAFSNSISLFGTPKFAIIDKGRIFENTVFKNFLSEMECSVHFITPEVHNENGQVERYCRTVLNMLRVEATINSTWSDTLWKLQLVLNTTLQKTTQASPLQLLVGIDGATPLLRSLVRDTAITDIHSNREALRELRRLRATELLNENRRKQDERVNKHRKPARVYRINDWVFVSKTAQMTGKLDSGMRGPYSVAKVLPHGRYELQLLGGSFGKVTQAAAEYMVPWRGEWTPEACAAFFENADNSETSSSQGVRADLVGPEDVPTSPQ